jgi:hypothetical protein
MVFFGDERVVFLTGNAQPFVAGVSQPESLNNMLHLMRKLPTLFRKFCKIILTGRIASSAKLLLNFQNGIFQKTYQPVPKRQGVVASLGQRGSWAVHRYEPPELPS